VIRDQWSQAPLHIMPLPRRARFSCLFLSFQGVASRLRPVSDASRGCVFDVFRTNISLPSYAPSIHGSGSNENQRNLPRKKAAGKRQTKLVKKWTRKGGPLCCLAKRRAVWAVGIRRGATRLGWGPAVGEDSSVVQCGPVWPSVVCNRLDAARVMR
jgi:hypothetical protein